MRTDFFNEKKQYTLLFLAILAFIPRIFNLLYFIEAPGDGPLRAAYAYFWGLKPFISTYGIWPPSYLYLPGLLSILLNHSLDAARIFNLALGTLTIPIFYLLLKKVYNHQVGFISALLLAWLPLHSELSATSLTEVSFEFYLLTAMLFFIMALKLPSNKKSTVYLGISMFFIILAEMTRYEAWLIAPLFLIFYSFFARNFFHSISMLFALVAFPLLWLIGNHIYWHDALIGFKSAIPISEPTNLGMALRWIAMTLASRIGVLLLTGLAGLIIQGYQIFRGKVDIVKAFYLSVIVVFWASSIRTAIIIGDSKFDRYLLTGIVLILPLTILPILNSCNNLLRITLTCVIVTSLLQLSLSPLDHSEARYYRNSIYLTTNKFTNIQQLAQWLNNSPYINRYVISTTMTYAISSYILFYCPRIGWRYSNLWKGTYPKIIDILHEHRFSILITDKNDYSYQRLIEKILGIKLDRNRLLYNDGMIQAYDLCKK